MVTFKDCLQTYLRAHREKDILSLCNENGASSIHMKVCKQDYYVLTKTKGPAALDTIKKTINNYSGIYLVENSGKSELNNREKHIKIRLPLKAGSTSVASDDFEDPCDLIDWDKVYRRYKVGKKLLSHVGQTSSVKRYADTNKEKPITKKQKLSPISMVDRIKQCLTKSRSTGYVVNDGDFSFLQFPIRMQHIKYLMEYTGRMVGTPVHFDQVSEYISKNYSHVAGFSVGVINDSGSEGMFYLNLPRKTQQDSCYPTCYDCIDYNLIKEKGLVNAGTQVEASLVGQPDTIAPGLFGYLGLPQQLETDVQVEGDEASSVNGLGSLSLDGVEIELIGEGLFAGLSVEKAGAKAAASAESAVNAAASAEAAAEAAVNAAASAEAAAEAAVNAAEVVNSCVGVPVTV